MKRRDLDLMMQEYLSKGKIIKKLAITASNIDFTRGRDPFSGFAHLKKHIYGAYTSSSASRKATRLARKQSA